MERLTRLCDATGGKFCKHTAGHFTGLYPDCTFGQVVERLAEYEDIGMTPQEIIVKLDTLTKALEYARAERDLLYKRMIERMIEGGKG